MRFSKSERTGEHYRLLLSRVVSEPDIPDEIIEYDLRLDASALAGVIRSVDLAMNEGAVARCIGLRKRRKK